MARQGGLGNRPSRADLVPLDTKDSFRLKKRKEKIWRRSSRENSKK
jgi:hypothetical protein